VRLGTQARPRSFSVPFSYKLSLLRPPITLSSSSTFNRQFPTTSDLISQFDPPLLPPPSSHSTFQAPLPTPSISIASLFVQVEEFNQSHFYYMSICGLYLKELLLLLHKYLCPARTRIMFNFVVFRCILHEPFPWNPSNVWYITGSIWPYIVSMLRNFTVFSVFLRRLWIVIATHL
jgi:hypothetical protein